MSALSQADRVAPHSEEDYIVIPSNSSSLLLGRVVLLEVVVCSVDCQPPPPLLGPPHGGEQEDVEDDQRDAGEHLHEYYTKPVSKTCMEDTRENQDMEYGVCIGKYMCKHKEHLLHFI